jgi:phosphomannomutase
LFKTGHTELLPESGVARRAYGQRYTDFFSGRTLKEKKILVYQHSAVGRDLLVEILEQLRAKVIPVGRSDSFVPIDTENVDNAILAAMQAFADAAATQYGPIDAVVSTDGDSDRPLILGLKPVEGEVGKRRVHFFGGDLVGMLVAEFLGANAVVVPITCNDGVDRGPLKDKLEPRTQVGSPYVIAGMEQAKRKGKTRICGWEANGGFLTGSDIEKDGRTLKALPIRDAVLPILAVLFCMVEQQVPLAELFDRLPKRYSRAALLKQFPRLVSGKILERFTPSRPSIVEAWFNDTEIHCRNARFLAIEASPAEVAQILGIRSELERFFNSRDGFGEIVKLNWTDGIRIHFSNGDVAHVRPSGNADELRIYAVADTQTRADGIACIGVSEPEGILRQLEKVVNQ